MPGGLHGLQNRYRTTTNVTMPSLAIASGSRPVQMGVPVSQSFQAGRPIVEGSNPDMRGLQLQQDLIQITQICQDVQENLRNVADNIPATGLIHDDGTFDNGTIINFAIGKLVMLNTLIDDSLHHLPTTMMRHGVTIRQPSGGRKKGIKIQKRRNDLVNYYLYI